MKILQSTIERLLYLILLLIFAVFVVFLSLTLKQDEKLNGLQKTIISNQIAQTQATKIYINCLVHINPAGDVQTQLNNCFESAPKVNK